MTTFRVHKTANYTVMSNHHLRSKTLSLKGKGLLSVMLSLPEDWDYSINGLSAISKEGVKAIRSTLQELESEGYLVRTRTRGDNGVFEYIYDIYEIPEPHYREGYAVEGNAEKGTQINKDNQLTKKQNTETKINNDKANAEPLPLIEPNIFIKELVKSGYIEQDELFMDQFNYFMQEIANQYGFDIARSCLMYFIKRNNGKDENGNPILNKFGYFKTSIENGVRQLTTEYNPEEIPESLHWLLAR